MFDSHAHLSDTTDLDSIIERAQKAGVKYIFNMGTKLEDWNSVLKISGNKSTSKSILPCLGIHPEEADSVTNSEWKSVLRSHKDDILMIGEIGLDYYWRDDNKIQQKELFRTQLELAKEFDLPVSIHLRDKDGSAYKDAFEILDQVNLSSEVVLHSFTGSFEDLKKAIDRGYYLGINGIITYTKAEDLRNVFKKYLGKMDQAEPVDFYKKHILFETDSPLLRPSNATTPGKENEPANAERVYRYLQRMFVK